MVGRCGFSVSGKQDFCKIVVDLAGEEFEDALCCLPGGRWLNRTFIPIFLKYPNPKEAIYPACQRPMNLADAK